VVVVKIAFGTDFKHNDQIDVAPPTLN